MAKRVARKVLPSGVWRSVSPFVNKWTKTVSQARLRSRMYSKPPGTIQTERLLNYTVRVHDGPLYFQLYKDIFIDRTYHFKAQRPDPLILDCGSNSGMSILYFKHVYPQARIIGFEPDPAIFPYLRENIELNRLDRIELVQAALAGREGKLTFYSDGKIGSCVADYLPRDVPQDWQKYEVPCVRLHSYLVEPVDFLKMNIEGAEYDVLNDVADRLRMVREMIIEYHHHPGLPRTLHKILALLHEQGFEYLVNRYGAARPPFRLTPETRYWLLVYARRFE